MGLKKEDKKLREEEERKIDPFEKKERKRIKVERSLKYAAEDEEAFTIKTKRMQNHWSDDQDEAKRTGKVQSFLDKVEWSKEEKPEIGGITWIEMYAWYVIHGGKEDEEEGRRKDPLKKLPMLQKQLADFRRQ